jgi:hypothetical protein
MTTLYQAWKGLNDDFMGLSGLKIIKVAGVYTYRSLVTIKATGFGLPKESVLLREQRLGLLRSRYVDPEVWQACIDRFKAAPTSVSHTFLFNRKGPRPKAGGCLLNIVLIREGKKSWKAMVTSRAIEVTMAMLADIAFVRQCLVELCDELKLELDVEGLPILWSIGVMHQNRVFVPVFFYDVGGAKGVHDWMQRRPRNEWEKVCQDHTVKMVRGDGVTGARKSWGKRLRKWGVDL